MTQGRLVSVIGSQPGERWQDFLHVGAGESGEPGMPPHWFALARIGTDSASRHAIVMSNGMLHYVLEYEGQSHGAYTLLGRPKHVAVNAQGDLLSVWRAFNSDDETTTEAMFLNGHLLLTTGTSVPTLDGAPLTAPLTSFLGVNTVSLSGRDSEGDVSVFFIGNLAVMGIDHPARKPTLYRLDYNVSTGKICSADWNLDGHVNSADISVFLAAWTADINAQPPTTVADFDNNGVTNSGDISAFLSTWLAGVGGDC